MDFTTNQLPIIAIAVLFACIPLIFLEKGLRATIRSLKLANLALFFGLAILASAAVRSHLMSPSTATWLLLTGILSLLFAGAGIMFSILALRAKKDGGTGTAKPTLALVLSAIYLMFALSMLIRVGHLSPGDPWVYQSSDNSFSLTLPSKRWQQVPLKGVTRVMAFVAPSPQMQFRVTKVQHSQGEENLNQRAKEIKTLVERNPLTRDSATFREGTNKNGNEYRCWTAMDSSPDGKPVFVAFSLTLNASSHTMTEIFFEGLSTKLSEGGKAADKEIIEQAAETICHNVK